MDFKEFHKLLTEAPISDFQRMGDWSPESPGHGFDKASRKLLTNEKYVEKIKTKWSKVEQHFDLYFVKGPGMRKYSEIGEVSRKFVNDVMDVDIPIREDRITVIFVNNRGDEKIPLTAWMLGHRFSHALRRRHQSIKSETKDGNWLNTDFEQIEEALDHLVKWVSKHVYGADLDRKPVYFSAYGSDREDRQHNQVVEKKKMKILQALGTFKSAREGKIARAGEMVHELVAQYIINGRVEFNKNLPKSIPYAYAWGRPSSSMHRQKDDDATYDGVENGELTVTGYIEQALMNAEGRVFVM